MLLDVDGTLIDSNDAHARAWVSALNRHGHPTPYEAVRPYIGKGGDKLLAELVGIDHESAEGEAINDTRRAVFADEMLPSLRPTAGARDLLSMCIDSGLRLIVASSAGDEELGALLRQAGVADLIQASATSSDAERSKPDPDIVQAALDKAGLTAESVVLLGDTPHDVEAAARAGVATIALRCGGWWDDAALGRAAAIYDDPAALLAAWRGAPPDSALAVDTQLGDRAGNPSDTPGTAPGRTADSAMHEAQVSHATPGESSAPHLPNDRDEVVGMTGGVPSEAIQTAARDLEAGREDTSRAAEADKAYQAQKR